MDHVDRDLAMGSRPDGAIEVAIQASGGFDQGGAGTLLRADRRVNRYVEGWPQQIIWIWELHSNLDRLRCYIELAAPRDETSLCGYCASGQDAAEFMSRRLDETKSPLAVEPLNCTCRHKSFLLVLMR